MCTFKCTLHNSQRHFLDYLKQVLLLDEFEAFVHCSIFNKTVHVFCLGENHTVVNNDCSSWYNRVGDFYASTGEKKRNFVWQGIGL